MYNINQVNFVLHDGRVYSYPAGDCHYHGAGSDYSGTKSAVGTRRAGFRIEPFSVKEHIRCQQIVADRCGSAPAGQDAAELFLAGKVFRRRICAMP